MSQKQQNIVRGRQSNLDQDRYQDEYQDEQNNFLGNNKNQPQQFKDSTENGNKLSLKISMFIVFLGVFYLFNTLFFKKTNYYGEWKEKIQDIILCDDQTFYFENKCVKECPQNYIQDVHNNLCISNKINASQIKKQTIQIQNSKKQFIQIDITASDFNSTLLDDEFNNRMVGIIFFNDFTNNDFSFLLHQIEGDILQNFLDNINGVIITFSGADSFYIENEKGINEQIKKVQDTYPQISSWYTCGFGFSGSFNALKFFTRYVDDFAGAFLQDPIENLSDFQELKGLEEFLKQKIDDDVELNLSYNLNKQIVKIAKTNVFVFKNRFYSNVSTPILSRLHPPNYQQFTYFDNNTVNFSTKVKYFMKYVMSLIEQQLSIKKKDTLNNLY